MISSSSHNSNSSGGSKHDRMARPALAEASLTREREELLIDLRSLFSNYGHPVANHICGEYVRYGHLKNTLRMLSLQQPRGLNQQCDLIIRHLDQVGPRGFLDHLQKNSGKETPQVDAPTPESKANLADEILDDAERRLMKRVMGNSPPSPINNAKTHVEEPEPESSPVPPASAPAPELLGDGVTICPKTGRPMKDGAYIERRSSQERRAGQERRSGTDRRQNLEVVFRNKRFGGDRRTGADRRSGQDRRKNPWTPPPQNDPSSQ